MKTRIIGGWGKSHLKTDIHRHILSTEPFLSDNIKMRCLQNITELSVNHQFLMYFHTSSKYDPSNTCKRLKLYKTQGRVGGISRNNAN